MARLSIIKLSSRRILGCVVAIYCSRAVLTADEIVGTSCTTSSTLMPIDFSKDYITFFRMAGNIFSLVLT